ncbi:MAG TPA: metallophosphoesterase [Ktedonobacterales bacterium]|jgi:3',5'-cyclic AMP phosphodiesterase CpdA
MMKLYAISDLHLAQSANRAALENLPAHPGDWLILGGDIGETEAHLHFALGCLTWKFERILWVPGNHDLWTLPSEPGALSGEAKYQRLVSICQSYGVLTPEDPYVLWPGDGPACRLAPLFTLYDYSFRPPHIPENLALAWAEEAGTLCTDEVLLHPDPYPSLVAWCEARCASTERRLMEAASGPPFVLINHFPLRQDLVYLPTIPRFSLWCGTRRTEDWHTRFPVLAVVYGHLHLRGTQFRDNVRFEEVSLGYTRDWRPEKGLQAYLREILPGNIVAPLPLAAKMPG